MKAECNNRRNIEIFFVRHGESYGNVDLQPPEPYAKDDPPLTPQGLRQAELLARRFEKGDIDCIISSSLIRTAQTVMPTAEKLGLPIIMIPDFNETDTESCGALPEVIKAKAPLAKPCTAEPTPPGGRIYIGKETQEEKALRAKRCIDWLLDNYEGKRILVATHGTFYSYLIRYAFNLELPELFYIKVRNCSVTHVIFTEGRAPALNTANDISHLNPYGNI